jgi:hypothetical protein
MFTDFVRISKLTAVVFKYKVIRLVFVTGFETVKERGTFVILFVEKKDSLRD